MAHPEGGPAHRIVLEGSHATVPDDTAAVRALASHVDKLGPEPATAEIAAWLDDHLDGLPHSAYVADRLVTVRVVTESMLGDSVTAVAEQEQLALGRQPETDSGY